MTSEQSITHLRLPLEKFTELSYRVEKAGGTKRTYGRFLIQAIVALTGFIGCLFIITITSSLSVQILNAIVFGFFSVQLGLLGHDLSHQGVFVKSARNTFWAMIVWGLFCGLSESRWYHKHNSHHQGPNHIGHDPDIEIPFVFSDEQIKTRSKFQTKYILPYQHYLFWLGLCLVYPYNIMTSMRYLLTTFNRQAIVEISLMSIHFCLLLSLSLAYLPIDIALLWNGVVFLTMGLYMGLIFAPNHKGEEMLETEAAYNWVYQITLTRNIKTACVGDYIMGGLQFQIEHHLFPQLSRFNYRKIQVVIKDFCQEHNIPYHETAWLTSMGQIHSSLKKAAFETRNTSYSSSEAAT